MAIAVEDFIKQIDDLTVLELNNLVKALEDHYGVSAAAAAVPMAAVAGAGAGGEASPAPPVELEGELASAPDPRNRELPVRREEPTVGI